MAEQTKIWAHRGASGYAPENTFEAFRMAAEMGADGVELDVQLTKDRRLVVIHDETLDRVSNGRGWVKDHTLQELKELNFNRTHPKCEYAAIPTLEEVYQWMKYTNLTVNVELKTSVFWYEGIEEQVLDAARQMRMSDRILYSSFNHYSVMRIKELDPEANTGFLYGDGFIDVPDYGRRMGVNALHPSYNCLKYPGLLEGCKRHGLDVHVWTVNREEQMRELCSQSIDAIITNYPDAALAVREEII